MITGWKRAALLGALAALALPPLTLFPVLLICVPGLLRLIETAPTRKIAFWRGYAFGVAHQICGIYWITSAVIVEAASYWWLVPFAVPLLAAILGLLTAFTCLVASYARSMDCRALLLAGAWVLTDLARQFIATGFPWNLWGSSLELPGNAGNVLIQIGALVGIHGMTLGVMLLASTPALSWRWRGIGAACFAAWIGFGVWRLHPPALARPGMSVVLVQGNVAEGQKSSRATAVAVFDRYLALSRTGLAKAGPGPRVLIWPETASPFLLGEDPAAREAIAGVMQPDTVALVGSVRYAGQTPYNSLFALSSSGQIANVYDKWHLVPFGEYQPTWLPGIELVPGSFGFGSGPRTLHLAGAPAFEPLICYEAAFTGQILDRADRPAWLVNVTNDAWFGNSSGPRQHLAAARMRAVEEGLPLLRAANTGISAGFDSQGRELGRLGLNRPGVLVLSLPTAGQRTFYGRFGLLIPLGLAAACLLGGGLITKRRRIVL